MTCVHLRRLYQICQQEGVKLSAPELIHIVCPRCGEKEVCPSQLMEGLESDDEASSPKPESPRPENGSDRDFSV